VVATDYAGLGTNFRSAVMDVESNATDVINSVRAARAALPQLGSRWVAMGPRLGANVTIGVAELEGEIRDPDYLGGVAISGVGDLEDTYDHLTKEQMASMAAFLAYGVKTAYPDFDVGELLSEKALPVYQRITESCSPDDPELATAEILKQNWKKDKFVEKFFDRNRLGRKPAYGPLLMITEELDTSVVPSVTAQAVARMCKVGDRVQVDRFSDAEPGQVVGSSVRDQRSWIESRFAGRPVRDSCR